MLRAGPGRLSSDPPLPDLGADRVFGPTWHTDVPGIGRQVSWEALTPELSSLDQGAGRVTRGLKPGDLVYLMNLPNPWCLCFTHLHSEAWARLICEAAASSRKLLVFASCLPSFRCPHCRDGGPFADFLVAVSSCGPCSAKLTAVRQPRPLQSPTGLACGGQEAVSGLGPMFQQPGLPPLLVFLASRADQDLLSPGAAGTRCPSLSSWTLNLGQPHPAATERCLQGNWGALIFIAFATPPHEWR